MAATPVQERQHWFIEDLTYNYITSLHKYLPGIDLSTATKDDLDLFCKTHYLLYSDPDPPTTSHSCCQHELIDHALWEHYTQSAFSKFSLSHFLQIDSSHLFRLRSVLQSGGVFVSNDSPAAEALYDAVHAKRNGIQILTKQCIEGLSFIEADRKAGLLGKKNAIHAERYGISIFRHVIGWGEAMDWTEGMVREILGDRDVGFFRSRRIRGMLERGFGRGRGKEKME